MAELIPQSFIDELLNRVDIVEIIAARIKNLRRAGREFSACCPFHQEKTPSFTISPLKQFYHCFGCHEHGNAISFLMRYENYEFVDAVSYLAAHVGMSLPETQYQTEQTKQATEQLHQILADVAEYYQLQLREHPQAKTAVDYLKGRGLSGKICKQFGIGFAPAGWDTLISHFGAEKRQLLLDAGMLTQRDNGEAYDRFRHRIMFPIYNRRHQMIGFGGRVIDADDTPKYLNSPETRVFQKGTELYGLHYILKNKTKPEQILVVEGYMDVVSLAQHGITNAVATLGTATTKMHIERLFRYVENIAFCFDGDRAGKAAAWRALEVVLPLLKDGVQVKFLFLPENEDPDSLVKQRGAEAFQQLLKKAETLPEYFFNKLSAEVDLSQIDGQVRLSKLALPLLQQMPDGVFRQALLRELASKTKINVAYLDQQATAEVLPLPTVTLNTKRNGLFNQKQKQTLMRTTLALILQYPNVAAKLTNKPLPDIDLRGVTVLQGLWMLLQQQELNTAALLEHWRGQPEADYLAQLAAWDILVPEHGVEAELTDCLKLLEKQSREQKMELLLEKANQTGLTSEERQTLQALLLQKTPVKNND